MIAHLFKRSVASCEHCTTYALANQGLLQALKQEQSAHALTRKTQSVQDRKITALRAAHPDLWQQFFAKGAGSDN